VPIFPENAASLRLHHQAGFRTIGTREPGTTVIGMALTAVAVAVMPLLGRAKHKLAARLGSAATAGKAPRTTCARRRPPPCWPGWP